MEKDEIKIWGKSLKFASKTTKEFSVTVIHDPFFGFSGSALRSVAALLPYATCRSSKKLQLQKQNRRKSSVGEAGRWFYEDQESRERVV